ncbi:MAG: hypothetical protein D6785_13850, partial [Planctomycetota bacterium]
MSSTYDQIRKKGYEIQKSLGKGNMGEVFLAQQLHLPNSKEDNKSQNLVALKLVSSSERDVQLLKEEFEHLSRLSHPNLCHVFDFHLLEPTLCFYTMEYIEGKNLLEASQGASWEEIIPWIVDLCRVLEYLALEDCVHCDLKPQNILINRDGTLKLLDFGLALFTTNYHESSLRGSLAYISPEMARGERVDHRSDLYSLGIVLYQIATGNVPFEGSKPWELLEKHLYQSPRRPSDMGHNIPPYLEEIILKLLAKEPSHRYQQAGEIIQVINQRGNYQFPLETHEIIKGRMENFNLMGREKERSFFKNFLEAKYGSPEEIGETEKRSFRKIKWIFLSSSLGMGKSRLLREWKWMAQCRGISTLFLELSQETYGKTALELLLSHYVQRQKKQKKGKGFDKIFSFLKMTRKKEEKKGEQFYFELAKALLDSEKEGFILFLDNLHYGGEDFQEFLKILANLEEERITIVASFSEEIPFWKELSQKPWASQEVKTFFLEPLSEEFMLAMVDSMFALKGRDRERVLEILLTSGGIPLLIKEILNSLMDHQILYYQNSRWRVNQEKLEAFELPQEISFLFGERLKKVSPEGYHLLKVLSLIGRACSRSLLTKILNLPSQKMTALLKELGRGHLVLEDMERPRWYRLANEKIRDVILANIEEENQQKLHLEIAQGMVEFGLTKEEEVSFGEIGYHFEKGGKKEKALDYYWKEGMQNLRQFSHQRGLQYLEKALEMMSKSDPRRIEALEQLGKTYLLKGKFQEAIQSFGELLDLGLSRDQRVEILMKLGRAYRKLGRSERALEFYEEGLSEIQSEKSNLKAELFAEYGWDLALLDRFKEAKEKIQKGFDAVEEEVSHGSSSLYNA